MVAFNPSFTDEEIVLLTYTLSNTLGNCLIWPHQTAVKDVDHVLSTATFSYQDVLST